MNTARIIHRLRQPREAELFRFLQKTQYWNQEKIREFQFEKLRKLLDHAYRNVPYYRSLFQDAGCFPGDIKCFDDFQRLPMLTKDMIRDAGDDLVAQNVAKADLIPNATGGSTGEPLSYYQDKQYHLWANAARYRGWYDIADCPIGARCAVLWGAMRDVRSDYSFRERMKALLRSGEVSLNAFNLSDQRKETFRKWCLWLRPKLLRGYVTAVNEFAHYIDQNHLPFPALKGIILCAETVDPSIQQHIERVFRTTAFNTYGGRETSLIAMECRSKNGLHEVSENNFIELEPVDLPGYESVGNIIVTNLNNFGMPFIRYKIGDMGIPSPNQRCDCGRGLPLISKIIGRTTEVFEFHEGTKIAGEMFIHLMKDFPISEYQFIQVSDSTVVLRLLNMAANDSALTRRIRNVYGEYLPRSVSLEIEPVDRFERSPTGKFRFVFKKTG